MTTTALRFGVVAGEASGDLLGGALIHALKQRLPDARFHGMAGPHMLAAGCEPLAHIDELSVMGLVEVLRSYPRLRRLRSRLVADFLKQRPDIVIGIDVPDFNLGLERRLRTGGLRTVHFVCPQVWAWREGRARSLAQSADLLLALLPFEAEFFRSRGVPAEFVGHPLADILPLDPQADSARRALGLATNGQLVALMPGSRRQELERLFEPFVAGAEVVRRNRPQIGFILCVARESDADWVRQALGKFPCEVFVGLSHQVLTAADVAIVASGTATLEALLCGTPMVVGYRLAPLSYHIIKRMVRIPRIALPNILSDSELVPELIQNDLTPARLGKAVLDWLDDAARRQNFLRVSREMHQLMRRDAAGTAADAILRLAERST